jgi:hypothetical protein
MICEILQIGDVDVGLKVTSVSVHHAMEDGYKAL